MILTPLQLLAIVTLILTVSALITWAMFMHLQDKLGQRINDLRHYMITSNQTHSRRIRDLRARTGANDIIIYHDDGTPSEDALAVWENIINHTRRGDRT
jgi:hypothetical protein